MFIGCNQDGHNRKFPPQFLFCDDHTKLLVIKETLLPVQLSVLLITKTEMKIPRFTISQPRYGSTGVTQGKAWNATINVIDQDIKTMDLPINVEIQEYIILVRPLLKIGEMPNDSEWRYLTFSSNELEKASRLVLPDLESIPLLSTELKAKQFLEYLQLSKENYLEQGIWLD